MPKTRNATSSRLSNDGAGAQGRSGLFSCQLPDLRVDPHAVNPECDPAIGDEVRGLGNKPPNSSRGADKESVPATRRYCRVGKSVERGVTRRLLDFKLHRPPRPPRSHFIQDLDADAML